MRKKRQEERAGYLKVPGGGIVITSTGGNSKRKKEEKGGELKMVDKKRTSDWEKRKRVTVSSQKPLGSKRGGQRGNGCVVAKKKTTCQSQGAGATWW